MKTIFLMLMTALMGCSSVIPCDQIWGKYESVGETPESKLQLLKWTNELLKGNKTCLDAIIVRGNLYNDLDSFDLAKRTYISALAIDSANTLCLYQLGLLHQMSNSTKEAIDCFTRAILSKTRNGVVMSYTKVPGLEDRYSKYDVKYEEILFSRGVSFYILRKLKSAINDFNSCLENNYSLKDVYFYIGVISYETGDKNKACVFFHKAEELNNLEANAFIKKYCSN